jgi:TRAP transporter TAXI family solute receptor
MTVSRRGLLKTAAVLSAGTLAGCTARASAKPPPWHDGRLFIATGNTTGVFYQIGGGFADLITRYVPGYDAHAEPSGASGDNIRRVASGDFDLGFANSDNAADAFTGKASFAGQPQKIAALSRIYRSYVQCVVRTAANINSFADLRGKRISTSSPNSGTDVLSGRILSVSNIDPDNDVIRQRLSLPETTKGMQAGTTDALFFVGGLPTPGITDLFASGPDKYRFLPLDTQLPALISKYGPTYGVAALPKKAYNLTVDTKTIVVFNMILVTPNMPDDLAYSLTKVLYEHQPELAKVHPEGRNFDKAGGPKTEPVPLHPGARRYFQQ